MKNYYYEIIKDNLYDFEKDLILKFKKEINKKLSLYIIDDDNKNGLVLGEKDGIRIILNNIFEQSFINFEIESRKKKKKENSFGIIIYSKTSNNEVLTYLEEKATILNKCNMFYCWILVK